MKTIFHDDSRKDEVNEFLAQWNNGSDHIICKSSGSTGEPKAIRLSKNRMVHSSRRTIEFFKLKPGMACATGLSMDTIAGKMTLVRCLEASMDFHVLPNNNNPLHGIKTPMNMISMAPIQAIKYLEEAETTYKDSIILLGGVAVTPQQMKLLSEFFNQAYESYGMTETASHVALRKIGQGPKEPFTALEGIHFSSADGRLCIHQRGEEPFDLLTNDCVELLDEHRFFYLGRHDTTINTGGKKVQPERIEAILQGFLEVPGFVVPIPDPQYGDLIGLVLEKGCNLPQMATLKTVLEKHEIPRKYQYVEKLPTLNLAKISRKLLHQMIDPNDWKTLL